MAELPSEARVVVIGGGIVGNSVAYHLAMEQWSSNRDVRLSPFNPRERELGAVFFEAAGWERPFWYASNERLLVEYGDRVMPREAEWGSHWWSPIINAEHLAMQDRVGIVDLSALAIFEVTGPGALEAMERLCVQPMDVPVGRVVYTPLLNEAGRVKADLTVTRLGEDRFRVVTGGLDGPRDRKWFVDQNSDPEAPILAQADWAVIGDLHQVIPAVVAAVREAKGA